MNAPHAPAVIDMDSHPHLAGVFAPQRLEIDAADLQIVGTLPAGLSGSYLRNGENPRFDPLGTYLYPIDGDGMVHRLTFRDGRASYSNRFVRTPAVVAEEKAGRALWAGILDPYFPDPATVGDELAGTTRDLPDINVVRHGGRLLALAESAPPFLLDGVDLHTVCRESFAGQLPAGMTAHPKIDPSTGEMVSFCYMLEPPYLMWSVVGADGAVTRGPTPVPGVEQPSMIHDMALTPNYVVLLLGPLYFDMAAMMTGGSLLQWKPEVGTRVAVIPRDGSPVRWGVTDAFWLWHTVNAYEDTDGSIVLDYVEWTRAGFVAESDLPNLSALTRARIDPMTGRISREVIAQADMEFPRIDDTLLTLRHRTAALVGESGIQDLVSGDADRAYWFDTDTGVETHWDSGDLAIGEPIYLSAGAADYWGMIATGRKDLESWFLVFPADDPASGPVARVKLPQRVPAGLHGAWLPD
ncbi:carotenoid oxygenase family protein [Tomitella biformata]|uniref:carotenoid oxygenase family protein n=1 Tax=Tomitella biformata TaxID=630403 RepID=UPI000463B46C|nr:carotenoid oxygenase family protein [Tomitella biformata]